MDPQKSGIDKNFIFAMVLCAALWFGWQSYLEKKYPEAMKPAEKNTTTAQTNPPTGPTTEATELNAETPTATTKKRLSEETPKGVETTWKYEDPEWRLVVSSFGGRISEVVLKNGISLTIGLFLCLT